MLHVPSGSLISSPAAHGEPPAATDGPWQAAKPVVCGRFLAEERVVGADVDRHQLGVTMRGQILQGICHLGALVLHVQRELGAVADG